jgi:two-component system sensor histidine kinase GlrK
MRFTILSRLLIGFLVIFALLMGGTVYGIFKLHQLNKGTRQIIRIDNRILDLKEKMTDSFLSQLRFERKFILTKDPLIYSQYLSAKKDFTNYFSEILPLADTPEKSKSLSQIKITYSRFQSLAEEEMGQIQADPPSFKKRYEQQIEKAGDEILEELKRLEAYTRRDINQRMKALDQAGTSAQKLAIVMTAITIGLALAISLLITRSIASPITLLMEKTKEISRGVFEGDLHISSPPEISQLSESFNSMCQRLKMVDQMKSDFLSTMSHELRTPLTSIKEGISLLRDGIGGTVGEKQKRLLNILAAETHRLIGLVNSLLDLSKMEAGMMTYHFEAGKLPPLIQRAMMEMVPLVEAKRIRLEAGMNEELPSVNMDGDRILQVLRNLIGNAVKFTPDGGRIRVSARPTNGGVEVSIEDTGPGIPKENMTTIFERFRQVPGKSSNPMKGTGLGLAIVKYIITAHGGKVWAENQPGQGSTFIFVLPL